MSNKEYRPSFNKKTGELNIPCSMCGKPIVQANERGMFCEDACEDTVSDDEIRSFLMSFLMRTFGHVE